MQIYPFPTPIMFSPEPVDISARQTLTAHSREIAPHCGEARILISWLVFEIGGHPTISRERSGLSCAKPSFPGSAGQPPE
jgi:hypothetical protein